MEQQKRDFLGVWIPKEIYLNVDLTPTEKLLVAEITSFSTNGICYANNEHFARFLGISKKHVSKLITKLSRMNLIKVELIYKENSKEVDKRYLTPIRMNEHTPPLADEHTPPHSSADPLLLDEYYKEQDKKQDKKQKDLNICSNSAELEREFESLWSSFPNKKGKRKAELSYTKARRENKTTFEEVKKGIELLLKAIELGIVGQQYVKNGSTWFNQHCWTDVYNFNSKPKNQPKTARDYVKQREEGEIYEFTRNRKIIDSDTGLLPESVQGF